MPEPRRVLAIRFSSIGDILLTTPLLRAIRRRYPDAHLAMLTKAGFSSLVSDNPNLNEVISLRRDHSIGALAGELRNRRFSHIMDLHGSLRSRALRVLVRAQWSGYRNHRLAREILIRSKRNVYPRSIPVPERYFDAARGLDIHPDGQPPDFYLSNEAREDAATWLLTSGLSSPTGLIALAPGAAHNTKRWPLEYWKELVQQLTAAGQPVVVVGGPEDFAMGESVAAAGAPLAANAAGRFTLQGTGAILARSTALITGDTGVMHMATGVGTSVVALFGPTVRPFGFFPYSPRALVIERDLGCRPCAAHGSARCPLGHHRCLRDTMPAEVVAMLRRAVA